MNESPTRFCCPWIQGVLGFSFAALLLGAGYFLGTREQGSSFSLPPQFIDASASDGSDEFSVATGMVSGDGEGFFVLDHVTGELNCYVIYARTNKFGAQYKVNVNEALAGAGLAAGAKGKKKYLMVTGNTALRARGNVTPAGTVVYVLDTTSGNFVAYGMQFNRSLVNSGQPQSGALVVLEAGQARQMAIRDQ